MLNLIETNLGYPIIIFYLISSIVLTLLYRKKLKTFFAFLYSLTVIAFNSSLWELPVMLTNANLFNSSNFITGLSYFIPLPLFILVYNIKLKLNSKLLSLILISIFISAVYGFVVPTQFQSQLGQYHSIGYLTTFIPRIVSLISLTYLCYPSVNNTKFNIQKEVI